MESNIWLVLTMDSIKDQVTNYKVVQQLLDAHPHLFDKNVWTKDNWDWVSALSWSRTFNDRIGNEDVASLIPFVDLVNHNAQKVPYSQYSQYRQHSQYSQYLQYLQYSQYLQYNNTHGSFMTNSCTASTLADIPVSTASNSSNR